MDIYNSKYFNILINHFFCFNIILVHHILQELKRNIWIKININHKTNIKKLLLFEFMSLFFFSHSNFASPLKKAKTIFQGVFINCYQKSLDKVFAITYMHFSFIWISLQNENEIETNKKVFFFSLKSQISERKKRHFVPANLDIGIYKKIERNYIRNGIKIEIK